VLANMEIPGVVLIDDADIRMAIGQDGLRVEVECRREQGSQPSWPTEAWDKDLRTDILMFV